MIIGIHPDLIGKESYSEKWVNILHSRGIEVRILNLLASDALDQAKGCDGIMWRWAHNPQDKQSAQRILYTIEHYLGIPVYPNSKTSWHYDEKVVQHYLLKVLKAPIPRTWIFWEQDEALRWAESAPYPVIFKLSSGAGSSNILKINTKQKAIDLIRRAFNQGIFPYTMNEFASSNGFRTSYGILQMFSRVKNSLAYILKNEYPPLHTLFWKPEHGYVYFQEFLPGNDFDTRISIIGDKAFGFRRMNRAHDFRASGSGNLNVEPTNIDLKCVKIAFKISKIAGFQSMAYDFLVKAGEPLICEISYAFTDWAVYGCPGHWDSNLNWTQGQMWPEEAQVEDFIQHIKSLR